MADFQFLKNPTTGKPVILAPRRSKRMDVSKKAEPVCPFCPGREAEEPELYRVPAKSTTSTTGTTSITGKEEEWLIRVIPNKFPFVQRHEIVILSPDHHKGFDEMPFSQVELILKTYCERYNANSSYGQVYIFHNGGLGSGESIPHPHSQITVVPHNVQLEIPPLDLGVYDRKSANKFSIFQVPFSIFKWDNKKINGKWQVDNGKLETDYFNVFCPSTSEWPDEVWVSPKRNGEGFGAISDDEITDFAFVISRLIQIFDLRHGNEFPFNFYISPEKQWYFRLIPRIKTLGGFEIGTNIMINTQDPKETLSFIREHLWEPNIEKIKTEQQAEYKRSA